MGKCIACHIEMKTGESCRFNLLKSSKGSHVRRIKYVGDINCGDCFIKPGGYHHIGCDMEECPACSRQLLSCDCDFTDYVIR
jgi:hypothetical protein